MASPSAPQTATSNISAKGTVVFVQGDAYLRTPDGKLTAIKPGDPVGEGQVIVTGPDAVVELALPSGAKVVVGADREVLLNDDFFATTPPETTEHIIANQGADVDKVIQALNAGQDPFGDLEDPAAGLTGGGVGDQTHDFVRLVRILEGVTPLAFNYTSSTDGIDFLPLTGATAETVTTTTTANTPPVAVNDGPINATEDTPADIPVLANDSDPDGDPLNVIGATALNGTVTVNQDGSLHYVPKADFNGTDTVTYTISDGKGGTATATVTINVAPVNDAPVANPDTATTNEDAPVTFAVLNNDTDVDGDTLTVTGATVDPDKGTVTVNPDGTLTFTPAANVNGPVTITYTVSDGNGGTSTATATVNVAPVNDAPVANPDTATTNEDTPVTFAVVSNDTDPDGDTLTVTGATVDPDKGTVAINPDGTLTFTPAANINGPVTITYTVSDGNGGISTATATVNVAPLNDAPVANPDTATTNEDTPVTFAVLGNDSDPDGDTLTVTGATVDPDKGTVAINPDGTLIFTPAADVNGPVTVTYTIADGNGGTSTTTAIVNVTPVNDPATLSADVGTVKEDTPAQSAASGVLTITDPDAGEAAFVAQTAVPGTYGSFTVAADGQWSYTIDNNLGAVQALKEGESKTEVFTVRSIDGTPTTVTITVLGTNDVPVATPDSASTNEDVPVTFDVLGNDTDPDGDTLTVTGATVDPDKGSVTVNLDGTLTFTPVANVNGPVTITYTIADGKGGTSTAVATVNVAPVNDAPVANPDTATTNEDTPVTFAVLGNDSDPDSDPLTVTAATVDPDKGTVAINPDGTLTFTPAANINGPVTITYTVSDGNGGTATSTATVNVTPVNDAPVATPDTATTNEDTPVTFAVLGNDSDPDGDPLTVTNATVDPTKGTVAINPDGTLTFTPAANVNGPVTITYTISDGHGGTSTTTATVDITPVNDPATLSADVGTVKEDTLAQSAASGVLTITDPDAGEAAFVAQTAVPGTYGSFTVATDGHWSYTIDNNLSAVQALKEGESKTEVFTVRSVDGTPTTVTITVLGTNDVPVAKPDTASTNEEVPVTFAVLGNDTDPDGDTLTVTSANVDPAKGTVAINADGTLTFTPAANVNGPVTVTYAIADGHGGTSTSTATINVTPVNDPAVISSGAGTVQEDVTLVAGGTLTITDPDAGEAAFVAQSGTPGTYGSFSINTAGDWYFTLRNGDPVVQALSDGDTRTESFTVTSIDGTTSTVAITILGTNEVIGAPGVGVVKEDNPITADGQLTASGGATFVAQPATPGTYGSLTLNPDGSWLYTLDNASNTVQSLADGETHTEVFPVVLSDGTTSTITITVIGTNDPAVVTPDSGIVIEDTRLTTGGVVTMTDVDAGETGFRPQTAVAGLYGVFTLDSSGNWTYALNNANPAVQALGVGQTLTETFPIATLDGTPSTVTVTIQGTNDGPVATPDTASTTEDTPVTFAVLGNDSDPDGDPLTVTSAAVDPAKGTVTVNPDGTLTFTPAANVNGPVTVTYTISDGQGGTATSIATVNVTPVNDAPVANPDTATTNEDVPVTFAVLTNDTDPDGDPLTVTGATVDPTKGSVTVNPDGTLTFTPATNINGPVTITYTVSDGHGGLATSTATVNVTPVNDAPIANPDTVTTNEDTPVTFPVLGNDTDPEGDPLTVTSATVDPAKGSVTVNPDGTLTFTPAANINGPVTITYTVSDGHGGTATTTATVNVAPVNDAPVANPDTIATNEDVPVTFPVLGNDTDPDGDPLTVTSATVDPAKGSVTVNPDGTLTFTPAANINGPVTITYTVSDGHGGLATSTATVNVAPVNDAPVANPDTATTNEDTPVTFPVLGNDTDPEGDPLTVTSATVDPAKGTVTVNPDGTLTFTPAANVNGPVTVTYSISDGQGGTATSIATVNITPVNDAPIANPDTATTNEDVPVTFAVLGNDTDPDGDPLTVTGATVDPAKGTVTVNPDGTLTFTPATNINGPVTITYTVSDGHGGTSTTTATVNVAPANDSPIANPDTAITNEDTPVTFNVLANDTDPEGDPLTVTSATVDPTKGTVTVNPDGTLTFTPAANINGPVTITYTVSDGHGGSSTTTATVTVAPVNDAPVANPDTATTNEDVPVTFAVLGNDTDPDGDPLTVTSATVDPARGTVAVNPDGTLTFTPAANINGPVTITYTVSDGHGGTATSTATVNVAPINDNPIAQDDFNGLVKTDATPASGNVITDPAGRDTDVDGDTLSVATVAGAPVSGATVVTGLYGTLTLHADGNYSYIQNTSNPAVTDLPPGASLKDSFSYTVVDGHGGSATAVLTITIAGTNTSPVANPDTATTNEDVPVTFAVLTNDTDPEGDALTVTGATVDPAKGSVTVNPDGTLTFTPAANVNGPVTITYTVSDGHGGTATTTATVNVAPVNDAPVANPDTIATNEDTPVTFPVLGNDTDPDGDPLTVTSATVDPAKGSVTVNPDGTLTFTPAGNINGPVTITYTVADGHGGTATTTATVNVAPVNDAPVANPDTATTNEDVPVTFAVLTNDTDPEGDALTVTGATVDPAKGSVTVNPDGTLTFTPAANINGPVTITYTVSDGHGGTATTTATVNVAPVNDAPIANPDTATTNEDVPVTFNVLTNDTDPDGDPLTVTSATVDPAKGSVTVNPDGTLTFTPAANVNGPITVTYTISDRQGGTATSIATVNITPVNDAPVANPDTATTNEDVPVTFAVLTNDTDPDGDPLTVTSATVDPTKGTVTVNPDGTLTFTPAANINGPVTITYTVSDGHGGSSTTTATVTVAPVNDAPVANPDTATTNEDVPVTFAVLGNDTDPDGDPLTVTGATVDPTKGTVTVNPDGTLTFTPAANINGPVTITYTVSDGHGGLATSTATVNVAPVNDAPIANPDTATTNEDVPVTFNVLSNDTDPDGDPLTVTSATVDPVKGSVTVNPDGTLTFTPAANINGPVTITYTVSDGHGGTATSTATVNVAPINDAPVANPDTIATNEDVPVTFPVLGNDTDPDGDPLTVTSANVDPAKGTVAINPDGTLTFTPAGNINGPVTITYTVSDGHGGTATSTATVNVAPVNDAPVANPDTATTNEDTPVTFNVLTNDSDPDGDPLTVTGATVDPTKGSVTVNPDGTLTFTPAANVNGPVTVTYTISDGHGGTATSIATVNITPVNDAPVANPDTATTNEDVPVTFAVLGNDTDPDGDPLTVTSATVDPTTGSVTVNPDGTLTFTPATNINGPVTITYTVSDGHGGLATSTATVNVAPVNDAPVANPDTATTNEDTPVTFPVLGNDTDPDGDPLTVTSATVDPTKGTVTVNPDGTLTFTPATDINGPVTITYTVSDGHGGLATSTATVNVTPVNDAPIANPDTATTNEDVPVTFNVLANDTDPDGDPLTVTSATIDPANGAVTVNPDGTLTFTPAANVNGPVTVTYTVSDGHGGTATSTATVNVAPVNDAPIANPDTATTNEDTPVTFNVLGNDTDPDGDPLTVTSANVDPAKGSVTVNPDGTLTFTPAANINGPVTITYTVSDGHGGTATTTATVNVAPVNDAPIANPDTIATNEDTPVTFPVLTNDTDPDGDPLTVTGATVDPTKGTVTVNPDGTLTFTPATNINGPVTITYTVSDGHGGTATTTATVNVAPVNDAPVANPDTATTNEDTPVTFNVLANDTDPDGDPLTVTSATVDPSIGTVTVNPDGTLTFSPAASVKGPVTVTYTISDGHGGTATSTATINVTPVNHAPVASPDTATTTEDASISSGVPGVLGNDTDVDSTTLTVTGAMTGTTGGFSAVGSSGLTLTGAYGTLHINGDGSYTYTPGAAAQALNVGDVGKDVFSYQVSDGALTSTSTLTIDVTGANDAAQINGPLYGRVKEDDASQSTAGGTLSIFDVDSPLSFNAATVAGTYGTFSINAIGTWTYVLNNASATVQALNQGDTRTEHFTVTAADGTTRSVTVDVLGSNELPTVSASSASGLEDAAAPIAISLAGSDVDGTITHLTVVDLPAHGTLYADAAMTQPITAGALISGASGTVFFKPDANWNGSTSFHFTATDNNGGVSSPATASIGVTAVNDAPVAANDSGSVLEDATLSVSAANGLITSTATPAGADTDVDGDALHVSAIRTGSETGSGTSGAVGTALTGTFGTLTLQTDGSYVYVANKANALAAGTTATDVFTYTVSDGSLSDTAELRITVTGTNDTPVIFGTLPNTSNVDHGTVSIATAGGFADPDSGDVLHYTATNLPAGLSIDPNTGLITGTLGSAASQSGPYAITVTATDNAGVSVSQTFTLTVANPAPTAVADSLTVAENQVGSGNILTGVGLGGDRADTDPDGDTLTVTRIGTGTSAPTTAVTAAGTTIVGTHGTLLIHADGSYSYTATDKSMKAGEQANDVFSYTVSDGQGGTSTTTLTVTLNGTNDVPTIGGTTSGAVTEDVTLTATGKLTITDPDAGQSGFQAGSVSGTYGKLTIDASGNWAYQLNNSAANVQSLKQGQQVIERLTVLSLDGTSQQIAIAINGTNDAPIVGPVTANVSEEGLAGGIADTIGTQDTTNLTTASGVIPMSDVEGNALTATLSPPPTGLTSQGTAVVWSGAGTQTLIGTANGVEVLRATIANDGSYTVKLSAPVDHADPTTEDVRTINIGVNVSDGITTTTGTLAVNVEDDAPMATTAQHAIVVPPIDSNILIILDTSASMTIKDGVGGTTRLQSAISALNTLLDSYDSFGEVRVRLVTFSNGGSAVGTSWTTIAQAKTQLAALVAGGGTNYDAAIAAGESAFMSPGKLASGQNISYFLSDGEPASTTVIDSTDEANWKTYLENNQITSFALGMGSGATQTYLDPIAYNGVAHSNIDAQVISDFNQLSTALRETVPTPTSGEILSGGLLGGTSAFGADGGHIQSITVDGVTYTYNATGAGSVTATGGTSHGSYDTITHELTVTTAAGGTLVVKINTGAYTYTPSATITTTTHDGFGFTLIDNDGDTAASTVDFVVSRASETTVQLTGSTSAIATSALGLTGEFYGYNETTSSTNTRTHADDTTFGNLDHVSDMVGIINGRSGQTIVGTYNAAPAAGADASFSADKIDYGFGYTVGSVSAPAVNGNLGNNPTITTANTTIGTGALYNFLRGSTSGADTTELHTTTAIGNTTDSGLRFVGLVNLDGGSYDIRVTADDGFRLNIDGQTVAMFDNIQSPTTRVYSGVALDSGLLPIELLYWEQGGNARLKVEFKLSSEADTAYKTLGTDDFALFTPTSAPTLAANQDIIEDPTQNGHWLVRSGAIYDGDANNDNVTGTDARDVINGGGGNDVINGGAGADTISGGAGNDTLTGGLGSDTFKWTLGDTGVAGKPAVDAITDFNKAAAGSATNGGDILDLRDLLQGESHTGTAVGNLNNYLHFEKSGSDTVIHISSSGGYVGGNFAAGATDQKIVLQGVDLTNSGALTNDTQIIQDLLTKGKLSAD